MMFQELCLLHFIYIWIAIAIILFPIQLFVSAPYGRHTKTTWGPMMSNKLGWIMMEAWALLAFWSVYFYFFNNNSYSLFFAILYTLHYIHRSFIFPLRTHTKGKQMPVFIALSALIFNSINASLIAYYLSDVSVYPENYFIKWNFVVGLILFVCGFLGNYKSDDILINLRKPGEKGYKIPSGFLFKYISCPNHFCEILEWLGYMLMLSNIAGIAFFVWTAANLLPRALHHHRWYKQNFKDYPSERKAVLPYVI